jgi:23S rRNA (uracil1939-C5)-methyltransferase
LVGAQGDGVSDTGLFVPLTLPGERVRVTGEGGRRELAEVVQASPDRVTPPCPHFGVCGGCALQHWSLDAYRQWKVDQVRLALTRARIDAEVELLFAAEPHSRRRLSLHARRAGGRAILGFKERRSWALAAIDTCVIADVALVAALPRLRQLALPFLEHPKSAPILHVTLTENGLDIDVTGVERKSGGLSADALMRVGAIAASADFARVTVAGETAYQSRPPRVRFGSATVDLPPGSFLQAVAGAEAAMADAVVAASVGAKRIADLYCGAGAFTFRLAGVAPVLAVDSSAPAVRALTRAFATAPGLKSIVAETRDLDRRPLLVADLAKIDVAVFDPPRAGAQAQASQFAASKVGRVIAVSCNPVTFVRDAGILIAGGYRLERVAVVDQFLWSPHIELVAVFSRGG